MSPSPRCQRRCRGRFDINIGRYFTLTNYNKNCLPLNLFAYILIFDLFSWSEICKENISYQISLHISFFDDGGPNRIFVAVVLGDVVLV